MDNFMVCPHEGSTHAVGAGYSGRGQRSKCININIRKWARL